MLKLLIVLCWIQLEVLFYCTVNAENPKLYNDLSIFEDNKLHVGYTCTAFGTAGDFLSLCQKKGSQEWKLQHTQHPDNTTNEMQVYKTMAFETSDDGTEIYCVQTDESGRKRKESHREIVKFPYQLPLETKMGIIATERSRETYPTTTVKDQSHDKTNLLSNNKDIISGEANYTDNERDISHNRPSFTANERHNERDFNDSKENLTNIEKFFSENVFDEDLSQNRFTLNLTPTIAISLIVFVLLIALSGIWLASRRNRPPTPEKQQKDDEGIYATPQVTYAVLDLQTSATDYVSIPSKEGEAPYAEIIGVYRRDSK